MTDYFTAKRDKMLKEFRETFGLPDEEQGLGLEVDRPTPDLGYCTPGCTICGGIGLVKSAGGWRSCPNNPRRFYGTGVDERDKNLWQVLPQTKIVERIKSTLSTVIQARKGFVYLHGTPGIGKTVCARAYTVEAIEAGMKAIYTRQSELINHLRTSYDTEHGQEEYKARMNSYKDVDWLVIDELGRDRMTDFAQESLAEIIDYRYALTPFADGVTVLVSNFPPEQIFQAYIVDRIRDKNNTVLSLQGKSLRA